MNSLYIICRYRLSGHGNCLLSSHNLGSNPSSGAIYNKTKSTTQEANDNGVILIPTALDITGMQFGYLTAIKKVPSKNKHTYWLCKCVCGAEKEIQTVHLTSGITTSCGCKKMDSYKNNCNERQLICPICDMEFTTSSPVRIYCYNCRPEELDDTDGLRAKKRALKHRLIVYKGGQCEKCGYNKCDGALQFHHRDPSQKEFNISHVNLNKNIFSMQDVLDEINKCSLLCANCHAEEHYLG